MDCFVCAKHRDGETMPGGPVGSDDLVVVSHVAPEGPGGVYLGHLVVEPRRHVAGLDGLADTEAAAVGLWLARGARALRVAAGAEHVYSMVVGHAVEHLHVHLMPRYPGTPARVLVGAAGRVAGRPARRRGRGGTRGQQPASTPRARGPIVSCPRPVNPSSWRHSRCTSRRSRTWPRPTQCSPSSSRARRSASSTRCG